MFKCILCKKYSLDVVCKECRYEFLTPSFYKRELERDFYVYSFYKYSEISYLLHTKHTFYGSKVYKILAKSSFFLFAKDFKYRQKVFALPIDDKATYLYSHTAILAKSLKSPFIKPIFNALRAKNNISYSKKTLDFRLKNPRDFVYKYKKDIDVILVDDIVTTGTTLKEAKELLEKENINVLFALTLADARL